MNRPLILMITVASTVFTAAIIGLVFWMLDNGEDAATKASTQFAGALVKSDPSLAPEGGAGYVDGVRSYFGAVTGARVIETRNHRVGSGDDGRTYFVADLLLDTARGPAVVELSFDTPSLTYSSDTVTDVRELEPREIDGLDDADLAAVAKAFVARGGRAAASFDLSTIAEVPEKRTDVPPPAVKRAKPPVESPAVRKAKRQLRCVQRAKGDVNRMARCS